MLPTEPKGLRDLVEAADHNMAGVGILKLGFLFVLKSTLNFLELSEKMFLFFYHFCEVLICFGYTVEVPKRWYLVMVELVWKRPGFAGSNGH